MQVTAASEELYMRFVIHDDSVPLRNDVDGEDTGTFAVVRDLPRLKTKLKAGAAKHRVYVLALTRVF